MQHRIKFVNYEGTTVANATAYNFDVDNLTTWQIAGNSLFLSFKNGNFIRIRLSTIIQIDNIIFMDNISVEERMKKAEETFVDIIATEFRGALIKRM